MQKTEMFNTNINGSWNIILPKHRHDRPEWGSEEGWEKERLQSIYENVKKGDIFLYVGNEEGDMSALIATWGCSLILIEPNPLVWANSKAIWEANNLEMPLACFVGFAANKTDYKKEDLVLNEFPECANGEVTSSHGFKDLWDEGNTLSTIKVDDLVELTGYVPQHISCDTEGSEWEILMGAEKTLREHKPNLWISCHPETMIMKYNHYLNDMRKWVRDIGYSEVILDYKHELHIFYKAL